MTRKLEKQIVELLNTCPLGFHDDHVLMARNTPERDVVAWLQCLYDLKDRLRAETAR